jgi:hypothetical protein
MGMLGKSKFHEMISSGQKTNTADESEDDNIINFSDIKK